MIGDVYFWQQYFSILVTFHASPVSFSGQTPLVALHAPAERPVPPPDALRVGAALQVVDGVALARVLAVAPVALKGPGAVRVGGAHRLHAWFSHNKIPKKTFVTLADRLPWAVVVTIAARAANAKNVLAILNFCGRYTVYF